MKFAGGKGGRKSGGAENEVVDASHDDGFDAPVGLGWSGAIQIVSKAATQQGIPSGQTFGGVLGDCAKQL